MLKEIKEINIIGFSAFSALAFNRAIFYLFLTGIGRSVIEISVLQISLFVSLFLSEIPTGIIGDKFGRKLSVILGSLLASFSTLFQYLWAGNYYLLLFSFVLHGISFAFISGSLSALLYELLKRHHFEEKFSKIFAKINLVDSVALALAMILGPIIKNYGGWWTVYALTTISTLIAAVVILPVNEAPKVSSVSESKPSFNVKDWKNNAINILHIAIPMTFVDACMTPVYMSSQLVLTELGASITLVGMVIGCVELLSILTVYLLVKKSLSMKRKDLMLITIFILILCALHILGNLWLSIGLLFLMCLVWSYAGLAQETEINHIIEDDQVRASTLSFMSFCSTIGVSGGYFLFGFFSKWYSYKTSLSLLAVFPLLGFVITMIIPSPKNRSTCAR